MIALLVGAGISLAFTLVVTPFFANLLRNLRLGQLIRQDTPTTHEVKRGTPGMGGVVFIVGSIVGYFAGTWIGGQTPTMAAALVLLMMGGLGLVGFLDDFLKVRRQNSAGLRGWYKIAGAALVAAVFALIGLFWKDENGYSPVSSALSGIRDTDWDAVKAFGVVGGTIVIVAWVALITVATSNAVNLTDGLDGLASGASIFALGSYIVIGFWQFQQSCASPQLLAENAAKCYEVSNPLDLAAAAACIAGSLIGFLWWNTSPARIFMGDSGSLALGGALAALAVQTRTELLLIVIGGLFIIVAGSVIVQIGVWRLSRRRVRLLQASPLHHHFEMKGWAEITIVVRFWLISALCAAAGVGLFYLEWLQR